MKHLLPVLALSLVISFFGGIIGAAAYNKLSTPKVLGTTIEEDHKEPQNIRTDFEDISFVSPEDSETEKGEDKGSKYIKFTKDNKIVSIEKDTFEVQQIQKELSCEKKPSCEHVSIGSITYTKEATPEVTKYMTAKGTTTIIIKFSNMTNHEQQSFLDSLTWL